jgi:hypothetical protein
MSVSKYNLLCLLILALAGCDEEDSGVKPTVEKYAMLEILSGNNQSGVTGQFLKDSIVIKVIPKSTALKVDRFYVRAKMTKGNGYLAELHYSETAFAASNGKIRTSWSLGCNEKDQLLTFYLYNYDSCMYNMLPAPVCAAVDSITIKASSSTPSGWNRSCGLVDPDYYFTKFKTFNGQNGETRCAMVGKDNHCTGNRCCRFRFYQYRQNFRSLRSTRGVHFQRHEGLEFTQQWFTRSKKSHRPLS